MNQNGLLPVRALVVLPSLISCRQGLVGLPTASGRGRRSQYAGNQSGVSSQERPIWTGLPATRAEQLLARGANVI